MDIDRSRVPFDNLAADGQTDARAVYLVPAVKALEHLENPFDFTHVKSDPIVRDGDPVTYCKRMIWPSAVV